jgi:asparagine synthase (glutamine-hydrolysing)
MCGICGVWSQTSDYGSDQLGSDLRAAITSLRHRGPDDTGLYTNEYGLGLGHTRLSILDLSSHGHQPKSSVDGRYTITYNGEIYNFRNLKEQLLIKGHVFAGTGDTEVILAALQEWGTEAVHRLIGMFAIAIWDGAAKALTLIRDRLGVKPLYYGWNGRIFWFGSELRALRHFNTWSPEIDQQALGEYLQYGYISAPRCIFEGIKKLPPGCMLTIRADGDLQVRRYWDASSVAGTPLSGTDDQLELQLEGLLEDAFNSRMIADVPVGVYLSGGIDSSLVAAVLSQNSNRRIHTYTIGFAEDTYNEAVWAKKVAAYLNTTHSEYILNRSEALAIAQEWGELFDEPFGDSSGIPTLLVSRIASADVKVVLSADGGDELFSGYDVYDLVLKRHEDLNRVPAWFRSATAAALKALPDNLSKDSGLLKLLPDHLSRKLLLRSRRLRATLHPMSLGRLHDTYVSHWLPEEIALLIGGYDSPRPLADHFPGTNIDQLSLWDLKHYLPGDILTKVDRTTMACSIEGREPLLDHRIAEFALRLPTHLRRGSLGSKHLLKKILYKRVPRHLVDRPKQGFAIPLDDWLKKDMRDLVDAYLIGGNRSYDHLFDPEIVRRSVDDYFAGNSQFMTRIWLLLAFEMWRDHWTS